MEKVFLSPAEEVLNIHFPFIKVLEVLKSQSGEDWVLIEIREKLWILKFELCASELFSEGEFFGMDIDKELLKKVLSKRAVTKQTSK